MALIWRAYLRVLEKHPWKTQLVQTGMLKSVNRLRELVKVVSNSGVIMGLGDVSAQVLVERKKISEIAPERILHFSALGVLLVGPSLKVWYHTLDFLVKPSKLAGFYKVLLDQSLFAPALLASFLGLHGLMQKREIEDLKVMYQKDYFNILKAGWTFWPAAQMVNFYLIPFHHRIFFVNVCALFWNTYLATQTNKIKPKKEVDLVA